jgi:putative endonuclease
MSSTDTGRKAESAAGVYLEMRGFQIIERNWRRPQCEVDIIAKKADIIYFVEVKYRRNDNQGGGFDYVTSSKLKKMQLAASSWAAETKWRGQYQLAAIELTGSDFVVTNFIDNAY